MLSDYQVMPSLAQEHNPNGRIVSYSLALDLESPMQFLRAFEGQARFFWQRGQYATAYAGVGMVLAFRAQGAARFAEIQTHIRQALANAEPDSSAPADIQPRFLGGFSFNECLAPDDALWQPFGAAQFVLPRLLLTRVGGYHWLTLSAYTNEKATAAVRAELKAEAQSIARHLHSHHASEPTALPQLLTLERGVQRETWISNVQRARQQIEDGIVQKVVLARANTLTFDRPVDAISALQTLEQHYPTAYRFLFEPVAGCAFFGATPELLLRMEDQQVQTAAVAGSIPRGSTPDEDDKLAAALLSSSKDLHEHQLVVTAIKTQLQTLARSLEAPTAPQIMKLKHIQHLFTPIQAYLREKQHILSLIARLHPTPALGGAPQQAAVAAIAQIEHIERGWYASPVGWVDRNGDGEFAVAIRSAVSAHHTARLYAGAGLVANSIPEREWDETALKFRPLMQALGASHASP
jgi:menaquinone-specific isochorismate synthase